LPKLEAFTSHGSQEYKIYQVKEIQENLNNKTKQKVERQERYNLSCI